MQVRGPGVLGWAQTPREEPWASNKEPEFHPQHSVCDGKAVTPPCPLRALPLLGGSKKAGRFLTVVVIALVLP